MATASATVMLVDRDDERRELTAQFLGLQQLAVRQANSLDRARRMLDSEPVDLLVLDASADPAPLAALVQGLGRSAPSTRIVAIDGEATPATAVTCMQAGAAGYLGRPFAFSDLLREIRDALARRQPVARPPAAPDGAAVQVNGYRVIETLSRSPRSLVYLVDKDGERGVMKIIRGQGETATTIKRLRRRFQRGAVAAAAIDHPHIARVLDFGVDEECHLSYVVLEVVAGVPLDDYRRRHPNLDYPQRVCLIRQVASALTALHAQRLWVRSLTPEHILVDDTGTAKLTELAFVRMPTSDLTLPGELIGDPDCLAPELFTGAKPGARSDLFSLGVLAYTFWLGQKPFFSPSLPELVRQVATAYPKAPATLDPTIPPALPKVLAALLAKDPARRYASAQAVVDDLDRILAGEPPRPPAPTLGQRLFGRDWE